MEYVITGKLSTMTRRQAAEAIELNGDSFKNRVTHKTAILVQGELSHWPSHKIELAIKYAGQGQKITVLTESEFLKKVGKQ